MTSHDPDWVLVPRNPTEEMLAAYQKMADWLKDDPAGVRYALCAAVENARGEPYWTAMIASAPPPPSRDDRVAKLEEALKPFALCGALLSDPATPLVSVSRTIGRDELPTVTVLLTVADLHRALTALGGDHGK